MARVHAGMAFQGDLFFAYEQWAGKGQRGKTWTSNPGDNIILSIVLEPVFLPVTQQFPLSAGIALACHDFFSRYAGTEETSIKWPNDLYWRDRKAGGILIENVFKGDRWSFAIAGIGININQVQFPETARNPVSLKQITGKTFHAPALARELGDCVGARYEQLRGEGGFSQSGALPGLKTVDAASMQPASAGGPAGLLTEYNARLYKRGQAVRLKKDGAVFATVVQGVSAAGELLTRDTLDRQFRVGEVEWYFPSI